ncbi:60S ribosome subunit biogenesis protein NIP7 homolog isoform X1 [Orcinus orca]|uniref:60S ribosome subunit biogenesis protein NIP7 homolog isoform X1 n=1 Tax=Orcinus orca TaxID=9733 RepID=UPI002112B999|nr:60S ribosome subunit biogenesis protein NIP7 homolog isoform X1 [Orcinus orca]
MRPLTEEETRVMFEKIAKYIGENLQLLVDRPDGTYCFRLHNDRVYYVSEKILKLAANISGDKLVSLGTCFGKFTKTHKFRLHITALDYLAPYAKYKVWIKPGAEQSFLYGNHVLKSGLGRITENTSQYQGVVVYSMADIPLFCDGFATLTLESLFPTSSLCVSLSSTSAISSTGRRVGTFLVVQWLRIQLPMQGTRVRALVREDPTCRRATKPMHNNY